MATVFLIFFSYLPFLLWFCCCLVKKQVRIVHLFLFSFAASIAVVLSVIARFVLEPLIRYVPSPVVPILGALVVTAIPEELSKLLAVLPFSKTGPDRSVLPSKTLFARAVCIALAFASLENIFFVFTVPGSLPFRFITAVPVHASLAVFSAQWLYVNLSSTRRSGSGMLFFAILLHAVYALGFELRPPFLGLSALTAVVTLSGAVFLWKTYGECDE